MTAEAVDVNGVVSAGTIEFLDNLGGLILQIKFDFATLFQPFGFGASELIGQGVEFSGPIVTPPLSERTFSFSFANQTEKPTGYTWTAAFTSSAVPEPSVLALLAVGSAAALWRRRAG